jgi:hypothetical protein
VSTAQFSKAEVNLIPDSKIDKVVVHRDFQSEGFVTIKHEAYFDHGLTRLWVENEISMTRKQAAEMLNVLAFILNTEEPNDERGIRVYSAEELREAEVLA